MIQIIPNAELEAIAKVFGDTNESFSGTEIGQILKNCNLYDPGASITKWRRICEGFNESQRLHTVGNHVGAFIVEAMKPARYLKNKELWRQRQEELNVILSLLGIGINNQGQLVKATKAFTIDEALQRVNQLKENLRQRNVHAEVFKYCTRELVANNYFHAVFEACKGVADRLRKITGINKDGAEIVDIAFAINSPLVIINKLESESEKSEHKGFANLLRGVFGMIRNPLAHDPRLNWNMSEQDALDIFSMLSMIHRKIDDMVYIGPKLS